MERMLIHPDRLREMAARLKATAREMKALERQLGNAFQSMDWETRLRSGMEGSVLGACREGERISARTDGMAAALERTAELFATTDREGSAKMANLFDSLAVNLPSDWTSRFAGAVGGQMAVGTVLGATAVAGAVAATQVPKAPPAPAAAVAYTKVTDPGDFPGKGKMTPEHIKFVQHALGLPESGTMDEKTKAAVGELQWQHRFEIGGVSSRADADGDIGPDTWRVLRAINHASGTQVNINGHNLNMLISDEEFLDKDAMTLDQIRGFLKEHNSILATESFPVWRMSAEYQQGVPGQIEYQRDGHTYYKYPTGETVDPAHLIYDASQKYGINPLVLLTKLQKESSLISSYQKWEGKLERMDETWVSTITGMGFGVPDNGTVQTKYSGIDKQIEWAAQRSIEMFNEEAPDTYPHVRSNLNYGEPETTLADGTKVPWALEVRNRATWVLYRYTPHITDIHITSGPGGGNYLFSTLYDTYKKQAAQ